MHSLKASDLTTSQHDHIRKSLLAIRNYGSGTPGRRMSWRRVIEEVAVLTDLPLPPMPLEQTSEALQRYRTEIRYMAERLRKYVEGPSKSRGQTQEPSDSMFPYLVEFLVHPEGGGHQIENLLKPDISLEAARHLAAFLGEGVSRDRKPVTIFQSESYWAMKSNCEPPIAIEMKAQSRISNVIEEYVPVSMKLFDPHSFSMIEHNIGWCVSLEEGYSLFVQKNLLTGENTLNIWYRLHPLEEEQFFLSVGIQDFLKDVPHFYEATSSLVKNSFALNLKNPETSPICRNILRDLSKTFLVFGPMKEIENNISGIFQDFVEEYKLNNLKLYSNDRGVFGVERMKDEDITLIEMILRSDLDGFSDLLNNGADPNYIQESTGLTSLHYIAGLARRDFLKTLLNRKDLKFNVRDNMGRLPSELAISAQSGSSLVRFLSTMENREVENSPSNVI